jgi:predicted O-methyltransferase YrrM
MPRSEVTLWYFDHPLELLPVPEHDEIFRDLVYRAPAEMVPALYQRRYYEDYFLLAQYFRPRSILEIGTRFGYSLIAMCRGAAPGRVVSIDLESYENCFDAPTQAVARRNLDACVGPAAGREFIVGDSHQVRVEETFDMIHVDGDHTEAGARDDVVMYFERLNPGGVMLVDDLDQPPVLNGFRAAVAALGLPGERVAFYPHKHGIGMLQR